MLSSLTFKQENTIQDEPMADLLKYIKNYKMGAKCLFFFFFFLYVSTGDVCVTFNKAQVEKMTASFWGKYK